MIGGVDPNKKQHLPSILYHLCNSIIGCTVTSLHEMLILSVYGTILLPSRVSDIHFLAIVDADEIIQELEPKPIHMVLFPILWESEVMWLMLVRACLSMLASANLIIIADFGYSCV